MSFLSGGAVPQTPGQGGVHEQFPLNNPPRFGVTYANSDNLLVLVWRWLKELWAAYLSRWMVRMVWVVVVSSVVFGWWVVLISSREIVVRLVGGLSEPL